MNESFFAFHDGLEIDSEIKCRVEINIDLELIFLFFQNYYEWLAFNPLYLFLIVTSVTPAASAISL